MPIYVKTLQPDTIVCQKTGCERSATHLFRSENLVAYCEFHAEVEANRCAVSLPTSMALTKSAGSVKRSVAPTL